MPGQNVNAEADVVVADNVDWQIQCTQRKFNKCVADNKFAYIVTLARAVNALGFCHSAMEDAGGGDAPKAKRARLNSYFFASAILYEALRLVRAMNQTFREDDVFQNGLRLLLRDKRAKAIEPNYLNRARNAAVFHFSPDKFAAIMKNTTSKRCVFVEARGEKNIDVHYSFADVLAGEILVGYASNSEEFYAELKEAMINTRELIIQFTTNAEKLIHQNLQQWGFKMKTMSS